MNIKKMQKTRVPPIPKGAIKYAIENGGRLAFGDWNYISSPIRTRKWTSFIGC